MSDSLFDNDELGSSDFGSDDFGSMSDIGSGSDSFADDTIGQTSDVAPRDEVPLQDSAAEPVAATSDEESPRKKRFEFSVFDAMLLIALVCTTLATLRLFFELRKFGNFPFSFPWRTSDAFLSFWL